MRAAGANTELGGQHRSICSKGESKPGLERGANGLAKTWPQLKTGVGKMQVRHQAGGGTRHSGCCRKLARRAAAPPAWGAHSLHGIGAGRRGRDIGVFCVLFSQMACDQMKAWKCARVGL